MTEPQPDLRPAPFTKYDAEILRRAAEACENVDAGDWFQWVPRHLIQLAERIEAVSS